MTKFHVTEVLVSEIPGRRSPRHEFVEDAKMRLEATEKRYALRYEFDDAKEAERCRQVLVKAFPKGAVVTRKLPNGGNCYLFVWRGPEWGKPQGGDKHESPA